MDEYRMAVADVRLARYGVQAAFQEIVESPGTYLDDWVSRGHFYLVPIFFRTALLRSGGLSPGEEWSADILLNINSTGA